MAGGPGGQATPRASVGERGTSGLEGVTLSEEVPDAAGAHTVRELAGRADALGAVEETLDAVVEDGGRTLLVSGEAGVGKSALVRAVGERAVERGFSVFSGRCRRDVADPFGPVVRAFEGADAGVVDHLRSRGGPVPDEPEAFTAQRNAQFNDVADEVRALATIEPVVVAIDDLQWADRATLALLAHFAETIREWIYPVLVVGAHRPFEAVDDRQAEQIERVATLDRTRAVAQEPLDRDATGDLVASHLDADPPTAFVDAVADHTDGNPLFARELLAHLRETGALDPAPGSYPERPATAGWPATLEATVGARRAARSAGERELLGAAATLGDDVATPLLAAALERPHAAVADGVSALADAGFWRVADGTVQFGSGAVRDAVLPDDGDVLGWHARAAEHLASEDDGTTGAAYAVGDHLEATGERVRARDWFVEAAERAMAAFAPEVALDATERARLLAGALGDHAGAREHALEAARTHIVLGELDEARDRTERARAASDDPAFRARTYEVAADLHFHRSEFERAVQAADEGLDVPAPDGLPRDVRRALLSVRGRAAVQGGELATARNANQRALALAEDDRTRAETLTDLAVAERRGGDLEEARSLLTEAIDLAESIDADDARAVAMRKLAIVDNHLGDVEAAAESYREVIATLQDRGDVSDLPAAMMDLGVCYYNLGRLDEALARWETTVGMADRIGREDTLALSLGNAGLVHLELGELEPAIERFERSVDLLESRGHRDRTALRQVTLAYARFLADEPDRAMGLVESALATAQDTSQKYAIGYAHELRGRFRLAAGDVAGAIADHEEGAAVAADLGNARVEADNRSHLAVDLVADDRPGEALAAAEAALDLVADSGQTLAVARVSARLGMARRAAGDLDGAEEALAAALAPQRERDNVPELCWTLLERARLERDRGDPDAARATLSEVADLAEYAGFELFVRRARELRAALADS